MTLKQPPRPPGAAERALQQAMAALQAGQADQAEWLAAEAVKANPADARAQHLLGHARLLQSRAAEAIAPLSEAVRRSHDPGAETQLAIALRQVGRSEEALERLQRAVKRKPPFPPAFLELGNLLSLLNRHDEAMEALQQGLAIAPNFADLSMQLGRVYARRGQNAQARAAFARAVVLAPKHLDALFALARACQAERDFAQAAETYRRLLAFAPKNAAAQIGLGVCLFELGRNEEALEHLRAASRTGAKMFGEALGALVDAGRGRFWLRPSDAARALRDGKD